MACKIHIANSVSIYMSEMSFMKRFDKRGAEQIVDNVCYLEFRCVQIAHMSLMHVNTGTHFPQIPFSRKEHNMQSIFFLLLLQNK